MKKFHVIVAVDENNGIGKNGDLPWKLPGDLKYFKKITTHVKNPQNKNAVLMGRKTWESIPDKFRPLPDRLNIVLSRDNNYDVPEGVLKFDDFDKALSILESSDFEDVENIFIIGGQQIFQYAVDHSDCAIVYVTKIFKTFDCDTFFPVELNSSQKMKESEVFQESDVSYQFVQYHV